MRAVLEWALKDESPESDRTHPSKIALRMAGALRPFWEVRGYLSDGRSYLAAALARASGHTQARANAVAGAAMLAWMQGDYAAARALFDELLAIHRELGDQHGIAWSVHQLGHMGYEQGEYGVARGLHEESLTILRELEHKQGIAWSTFELGNVARKQG